MHLYPDISICTVVPNGDDRVIALLASVREASDPVSIETAVVVNGDSSAFSRRLDSLFPQAKILENRSPVRNSRARNQALRLCTGRYLSLWDPDVVVRPQCLLQLALFLDEHPETGIVVPRIENSAGTDFLSVRSFPTLLSMLIKYSGLAFLFPRLLSKPPDRPASSGKTPFFEVDWAIASAMVIRREVLEEIGYFDERYLAAYDDTDFCRRARKAGWHIAFLPGARVFHNNRDRYDATRILDLDPLSSGPSPRTHPEQLLDAARYLFGSLVRH